MSGEDRARERRTTAAAFAIALGIGALYARPFLGIVWRRGMGWPVRLDGEGPSLSTYGRWWVLPPHRYLTDGFSGEFPTFYNYLSDAILNAVSAPFGWPPMTVQAAVYGPLLGALLFLAGYHAMRTLLGNSRDGLVAAMLVSLGVSSGAPRLVPGLDVGWLERTLHTPFHAVSLGTSQSVGWVLFLPVLALFYLAVERFTPKRAVAFGALMGVLAHAHTLTFLNAGLVQVAWLIVRRALEPAGRAGPWRLAVAVATFGFALRAALGPPLTLGLLASASAILVGLAFLADDDRRPYLWGYGVAALVIAPYALAVLRGADDLSRLSEKSHLASVPPLALLAFYAPGILAAGFAVARAGDRRLVAFLTTAVATTLLLAYNHLWNWGNHPYRFAIHILFPLAPLVVLGLRRAPPPAARALGAWLVAAAAAGVVRFAAGERIYLTERVVVEDTADYLSRLRRVTAGEPAEARILNFPEFHYPIGVTQNALVFNYSARPGFLPDYRYLLERERYFNRLALFCFLFPGYPAYEAHFERHACAEALEPPAELLLLRDPRVRTAILPAYRIGLAASSGKPFGSSLAAAQETYGWPTVEGEGLRRLVRTAIPVVTGLARFDAAEDEGRVLPFEVEIPGPHVVAIAGRRLVDRLAGARVDGRDVRGQYLVNWALLRADLPSGRHRLELVPRQGGHDESRDLLYFAVVVAEAAASGLLEIPRAPKDADAVSSQDP